MRPRLVLAAVVVGIGSASAAMAIPISIVNNLPGTFIDISGTGTQLNPGTDGTDTTPMGPVGNILFPSGGNAKVAENGAVGFRNPPNNNVAPNNAPIPSNNLYGGGQSIAGYWDDLTACPGKMGGIFRATSGSTLIIQYDKVCARHATTGANPDLLTFQIQIFSNPLPAPGILAQIIYADIQAPGVDGGAGATIGYQDDALGNNDFQWSFNTSGAVMDGTVLSIVPEPAAALLIGVAIPAMAFRRTRRRA